MKPRVYIETSVWSFAFAKDVPDYQRDTLTFFECCRTGDYRTYISAVVLEEIEAAEEPVRSDLLSLLTQIRKFWSSLLNRNDSPKPFYGQRSCPRASRKMLSMRLLLLFPSWTF
jgi:hypothetical protein